MVRGGTARGLKLIERIVRVNVSDLFENRSLWALYDDSRASALSQASHQKERETGRGDRLFSSRRSPQNFRRSWQRASGYIQ
jgi:hypothetical protein